MSIFGFFAVVIICLTLCVCVTIVCKIGITITHLHKDLTEYHTETKNTVRFTEQDKDKLEKEINEQQVTKASMDAVIRSCNELMGISTEEEDEDGKA